MRTTLTLDPDVELRLKTKCAKNNLTFKEAVNDTLRRGLMVPAKKSPRRFRVAAKPLGARPGIDAYKMNQLADELDTAATVVKLK